MLLLKADLNLFFIVAPLLIGILMPALIFALSRQGWVTLAKRYRHAGGFDGQRVGVISAAVNSGNYKNSLLLKYNTDGFYLRPVFIFRIFHAPVFIPWTEVAAINDRSVMRGNTKELVIGRPEIARITILESTFRQIENAVPPGISSEPQTGIPRQQSASGTNRE